MKDLKEYVRTIPDHPKPGIMFRDVTSVLQDADGLKLAIDSMMEKCGDPDSFDVIVGTESRGFVFGMPIAYNLHKPFIMVRKKGKLPCETISREYDLEYGTAELHIHLDAIKPGDKVLLVDDLIATGGTMVAQVKLIERLGAELVGIACLMELEFFNPRSILAEVTDKELHSLVKIQ